MDMGQWSTIVGLGVLGLVACGSPRPEPLEKAVLIEQTEPSIVRIFYGDRSGQGTGFIIEGEPGVCTVATAAQVVEPSELILVSTHDSDTVNQGAFPAQAKQAWPNDLDLAIITFNAPGENCPYASLSLGDSGRLKKQDRLYLFGFPEDSEKVLYPLQVAQGEISRLAKGNAKGYDITYTSDSAAGMSGGPLVNAWGEVVGVQGQAEAASRLAIPSAQLQKQLAAVVAQLPEATEENAQSLVEQGKALFKEEKYLTALPYFDRAIRMELNYAEAWTKRAYVLNKLKRYEEALKSSEKALEINPDFAEAWNNRGISLRRLKKYEEAIAAYDKAIEINPDYVGAWSNRGVSLRRLKKYEEAIAAYDKAIE
ncbi:MAG: serine protease, partial [Spirulina sp. SIO3F2]|nr:serine protease [Spirulina sp. SIO3F2]